MYILKLATRKSEEEAVSGFDFVVAAFWEVVFGQREGGAGNAHKSTINSV